MLNTPVQQQSGNWLWNQSKKSQRNVCLHQHGLFYATENDKGIFLFDQQEFILEVSQCSNKQIKIYADIKPQLLQKNWSSKWTGRQPGIWWIICNYVNYSENHSGDCFYTYHNIVCKIVG